MPSRPDFPVKLEAVQNYFLEQLSSSGTSDIRMHLLPFQRELQGRGIDKSVFVKKLNEILKELAQTFAEAYIQTARSETSLPKIGFSSAMSRGAVARYRIENDLIELSVSDVIECLRPQLYTEERDPTKVLFYRVKLHLVIPHEMEHHAQYQDPEYRPLIEAVPTPDMYLQQGNKQAYLDDPREKNARAASLEHFKAWVQDEYKSGRLSKEQLEEVKVIFEILWEGIMLRSSQSYPESEPPAQSSNP